MNDNTLNEFQELSQEEVEQIQGGDCNDFDPSSALPSRCRGDDGSYLFFGYYKNTTVNP